MTTRTGTLYATQKPFGCSTHRVIRGNYPAFFQGVMHQHKLAPLVLIMRSIQSHANIKRKGVGTYSLFMAVQGSRKRRVCWRAFPASLRFDVHVQRRGRAYPVQGGGVVVSQSVGQIWPTY